MVTSTFLFVFIFIHFLTTALGIIANGVDGECDYQDADSEPEIVGASDAAASVCSLADTVDGAPTWAFFSITLEVGSISGWDRDDAIVPRWGSASGAASSSGTAVATTSAATSFKVHTSACRSAAGTCLDHFW